MADSKGCHFPLNYPINIDAFLKQAITFGIFHEENRAQIEMQPNKIPNATPASQAQKKKTSVNCIVEDGALRLTLSFPAWPRIARFSGQEGV